MLTDLLIGQTIAVADDTIRNFQYLIMGQPVNESELGDSVAFSTLSEFPTRVRCGALAWHTMAAILNDWRAANG